ncbi:MAG: hypothetical protein NC230_09265 [Bacteroides sp.]|nr:hypothetical protein [Bacteroides sp.]
MRNTMLARESDIQSIKDLCSAQQEIGIIGDEVQLAGAQEMATYLGEKESLEKLIPVMNDMLAQQYGVNATQENAAQIATMLGKVMEGQTGALGRYGYSFDEAQEKILKFGTESERAAVLAEVVESAVGGMNQELAKTDIGQQKQLENKLGDIKEQLGAVAQKLLPVITGMAQLTIAAGGVMKLAMGIRTLVSTIASWHVGQKAVNLVIAATGIYSKKAALGLTMMQTSAKGAQRAVFALQIGLRGLMMATVVGAALWGLVTVISKLTGANDEAADSTKRLIDRQEYQKRVAEQTAQQQSAENSALVNNRAQLELNITKLKDFNGTKSEEYKLVNEMNDTYGETMGYFSTVADWYETLKKNSAAYCQQMVVEARTRSLANQIAQAEQDAHDIEFNPDGTKRVYSNERARANPLRYIAQRLAGKGASAANAVAVMEANPGKSLEELTDSSGNIIGSSEAELANARLKEIKANVKSLKKQMEDAVAEASSIDFEVKGSKDRPDLPNGAASTRMSDKPTLSKIENPGTIKDINNNIKYLENEKLTATGKTLADINVELEELKTKRAALESLGVSAEEAEAAINEDAETIRELQQNIRLLDEQILDASPDKIAALTAQRDAYQQQIDKLRGMAKEVKNENKSFNELAGTLQEIEDNISVLNENLKSATMEEAVSINRQIELWQKKADAIRQAGKASESTFDKMRDGWGSAKGLAGGIEGITKSVKENGNAWSRISGIIDGALSVYDGIKNAITLVTLLTAATGAKTAAEKNDAAATQESAIALWAKYTASQLTAAADATAGAAAGVKAAAESADATATMSAAAANIFKAHSWLPWVGVALGAAGVAMMIATMAGLPKFADGGIISGPTIGLMGEYSGASNNPEVVAPLDKLRSMLDMDGGGAGKVEFEIRGDRLYGILERQKRHMART